MLLKDWLASPGEKQQWLGKGERRQQESGTKKGLRVRAAWVLMMQSGQRDCSDISRVLFPSSACMFVPPPEMRKGGEGSGGL